MSSPRPLSRLAAVVLATLALGSGSTDAGTQGGAPVGVSTADLAKATQNPVGSLTILPFQFNFNSGGSLADRTFYNLNVQPVFPLRLSEDWNLIARTIIPYVSYPLPGATPGLEPRATGIGDIQQQLYLTPVEPGDPIWGVGALGSFPTATNELVRTGDWAIGPTAVALRITGPWVIGALANQLWTVGGDDIGEDVDVTLIQPFINYNLARGWAMTTGPIITRNGAITSGEQRTVPVGGGVSKVASIGKQPISLAMLHFHNAIRPEGAPEDQLRMAFSLLYPVAN